MSPVRAEASVSTEENKLPNEELLKLRRLIEEEEAKILEQDMKMKAEGWTHRVTWWNHRTGGSDIQTDMYFGCDPRELTLEDGKAWEEWRRILYESVDNKKDYQIITLTEVGFFSDPGCDDCKEGPCETCGRTQ